MINIFSRFSYAPLLSTLDIPVASMSTSAACTVPASNAIVLMVGSAQLRVEGCVDPATLA
ncbi:hypothetical protein [Collimonas antrihumi]|uniref:hypothetical protein n=1 Tax=Collimonas antrihumi TaxID=1940615 RepID=UPI001B8CEDBE|nr:hypothetical protein [Collimonas antrihumi]